MNISHPRDWKFKSPDLPGLHEVICPENSPFNNLWVFRLNLNTSDSIILGRDDLELNPVVISGQIIVEHIHGRNSLSKMDSFYIPGNDFVKLTAEKDSILFIGGSQWRGTGTFFIRNFNYSLPLGNVHQIQGYPPFEQEIWMTVNQKDNTSSLISGFTWGGIGAWTSIPPSQSNNNNEKVFCYYDLPAPQFALHLSSRTSEIIEATHPVQTGDFVIVPEEYYPTVGSPGSRSSYFWIMATHSPDLGV